MKVPESTLAAIEAAQNAWDGGPVGCEFSDMMARHLGDLIASARAYRQLHDSLETTGIGPMLMASEDAAILRRKLSGFRSCLQDITTRIGVARNPGEIRAELERLLNERAYQI